METGNQGHPPKIFFIWFIFLSLLIIFQSVLLVLDHRPIFFFGDSGSYIWSAVSGNPPSDRSFVYPCFIRLIAVNAKSLEALVFLQVLLFCVVSAVMAHLLIRYLGVKPWLAFAVAFLSTMEPLQLLYTRYVMTETLALFVFVFYLWLVFHYLETHRMKWLIVIQFVATIMISVRLAFIPLVWICAPMLPIIAFAPIAFQERLNRERINRIALHLLTSVFLLFMFTTAYKHIHGHLHNKPPAYSYDNGFFALAYIAPIVEPDDFVDKKMGGKLFNDLRFSVHDRNMRGAQHWMEGGMIELLKKMEPDRMKANSIANQTAIRAILRKPFNFVCLGFYTLTDYLDVTRLKTSLDDDLGSVRIDDGTFHIIKTKFNYSGDQSSALDIKTLTGRHFLRSIYWIQFLLFLPVIWVVLFFLTSDVGQRHKLLLLFLFSVMFVGEALYLVERLTPRYLHIIAWLACIATGISLNNIFTRLSLNTLLKIAFFAVIPLCFGLYSLWLGQDTNWDLLNYHLYNPYAFLNHRLCFDLAPAGLQTYFNPFLDVLYFQAIGCWSPRTVGFLLGVIHGLNFVLLFYLCRCILNSLNLNKALSVFLSLAGVLSIGFLSEIGTTFHDNTCALFCLSSVLLIVLSMKPILENRRKAISAMILSGAVIGVSVALKPVMAIYALAVCLSLLTLPVSLKNRLKLSFIFGFTVLFALSLAGGYWFHKIWSDFGNPLFPQYNHIFSGGLAQPDPMRDLRFLPKSFFEKIFYPLIFTIHPQRTAELPYRQISWLILYVAVIIFGLNRLIPYSRRNSSYLSLSPEAVFLVVYFCLGYLFWLNMFGVYRYLISLELLIPLVLFILLSAMMKSKWLPAGIVLIIVVMTVVNVKNVPDWGHAPWSKKAFDVVSQDIQDPETKTLFLAGQPLAWLAPALHINARFIQLLPNFSVSDAYWQRAQSFIGDGNCYVILGREDKTVFAKADERLHKIGLFLDGSTCKTMDAYLGATLIHYDYCKARKESDKMRKGVYEVSEIRSVKQRL